MASMTVHEFFMLLGVSASTDPMDVGWFERFGFAAGLLLLLLFGVYRLARLGINKVGDAICDWFKEQTEFIRDLREAIPTAKQQLLERNETLASMDESLGGLQDGQTRIMTLNEEAIALGRANQGDES